MLKGIVVLVLAASCAGCLTFSGGVRPGTQEERLRSVNAAVPLEKKRPALLGLVFGKTIFEGLLKAPYVRLTIIPRNDPSHKMFFVVGDKANQSVVPWAEGKVIEPGYFYLELPPGNYEIVSLAIPVGSTTAEEPMALDFVVPSHRVNYLGTLRVTGTKERVKFGGLPVVRPGFEYTLLVEDDFSAAKKDFESRLPQHKAPVHKGLLDIKTADGIFEMPEPKI